MSSYDMMRLRKGFQDGKAIQASNIKHKYVNKKPK